VCTSINVCTKLLIALFIAYASFDLAYVEVNLMKPDSPVLTTNSLAKIIICVVFKVVRYFDFHSQMGKI